MFAETPRNSHITQDAVKQRSPCGPTSVFSTAGMKMKSLSVLYLPKTMALTTNKTNYVMHCSLIQERVH